MQVGDELLRAELELVPAVVLDVLVDRVLHVELLRFELLLVVENLVHEPLVVRGLAAPVVLSENLVVLVVEN